MAAALLHYEIFWHLFLFLELKQRYVFIEVVILAGAEILILSILGAVCYMRFSRRVYMLIGGLFLIGTAALFTTGFYPSWFAFDRGRAALDPHLVYPFNVNWALSKIPLVGWIGVVAPRPTADYVAEEWRDCQEELLR